MKNRDFDKWLSTMNDSIATWKYYTDFEKVYKNAEKIKTEIYILNSLMNSKNIREDFKKLLLEYPQILKVIPLLIAKRTTDVIIINDTVQKYYYNFKKMNYSIDEYALFMENTGIFDLLSNHLIANLYDYILGVEVGLDTNTRKNRTGKAMETLVESYILQSGFVKEKNYFTQVSKNRLKEDFNIDLSNLKIDEIFKSSKKEKSEKKFDFVVKTEQKYYLIETNFYTTQGSKLNETARSYKELALEFKDLDNIDFVWITDGKGWQTTKKNLQETFNILDNIYNINDMENGILTKLFK